MYIQLTTLCNMACPHCAFSCAPGKPFEHMDTYTYNKCLELVSDYCESICLGGGEPTLHPQFWPMLGEALRYANDDAGVWLATNGSKTKDSILLAHLAGLCQNPENIKTYLEIFGDPYDFDKETGELIYEPHELAQYLPEYIFRDPPTEYFFSCALSLDAYHAPINPRVKDAFNRNNQEIRDATFNLANVGAAKANQLGGKDECACSTIFIRPDGTAQLCGCPDSPTIGTIDDLLRDPDLYEAAYEFVNEYGCGWRAPEFQHPYRKAA